MTARDPRPGDRTEKLPVAPETEQMPLDRTELLPENPPDGPTTPMRQVRSRSEDGPWPAIPMLPVIRPDEVPLSEVDRVRESRGVQALRKFLDDEQQRDPDAPAWPTDRETPEP